MESQCARIHSPRMDHNLLVLRNWNGVQEYMAPAPLEPHDLRGLCCSLLDLSRDPHRVDFQPAVLIFHSRGSVVDRGERRFALLAKPGIGV